MEWAKEQLVAAAARHRANLRQASPESDDLGDAMQIDQLPAKQQPQQGEEAALLACHGSVAC
jgi:hypothetical protein